MMFIRYYAEIIWPILIGFILQSYDMKIDISSEITNNDR